MMKVDMKGGGTQQQQCKMKVSSHCFSKISKLSSCKVLKNILKKSQSRISAVCLLRTHYWKNQIFVHKFNSKFSQVFHPNFFWQFFSWNQNCQQLKSPKPQHFHPIKSTIFSGNQSWIFWQKMKISNSVSHRGRRRPHFEQRIRKVAWLKNKTFPS